MSKQEEIPKGERITGSITKYMDRRFLSSLDFVGQDEINLTVDRLEIVKEMKYQTGRAKENVILMYFKETGKPLELNTTNEKAMAFLMETNKVKAWEGAKVTLKSVRLPRAFNGNTHGVRITDAVRVVE